MAAEYSFGEIQLNTVERERDYHRRREEGEIQHTDVVDDICRGLLLQGRIDRIVHGKEQDGKGPATLIIFGFRFHGIDTNRRFKQAKVTIVFQDEKKQHGADPVPIVLWPNGDYTLGNETEIDTETTQAIEGGGKAGVGGGPAEAEVNAQWRWERKEQYKKTDRASMTGSIVLDTDVRESGANNAIRLTITENEKATSGLVTDLRVAVLLRRKNDTDRFSASIKIKAKAHFPYNAVRAFRDLIGLAPPNDAVIFQPDLPPYLRPPTLTPSMEANLAGKVDKDNLNAAQLNTLASAVATTVLTTSVTA